MNAPLGRSNRTTVRVSVPVTALISFGRVADEPELAEAGGPPPPLRADRHPSGPIYSSGALLAQAAQWTRALGRGRTNPRGAVCPGAKNLRSD